MKKSISQDLKHLYYYSASVIFLYIFYKSSAITFGDGIGFMHSIKKGFDISTAATSHFLYINFLKIVNDIVPFLDGIEKAVSVSIFFSILTLLMVYRCCLLLTNNMTASLMSAMLLGLSFTYWRQTEIIEVYTTNCFIVSWLIWTVLKKNTIEKTGQLNSGLILGISLLVHIQNILLIPFYIFHIYLKKNDRTYIITGIISFVLTSSVLFIIPVLFNTNSITSIFFINDNIRDKAIGFDLSVIIQGFFKSILYFLYNYSFFIVFIIHGATILFKKDLKLFTLLFLAGALIWLFSMKYNVTDNYVFFLTSYMVCCIASCLSFSYFLDKLDVHYHPFIPLSLFILPVIYFITPLLAINFDEGRKFNEIKKYKGGLQYYLWPGMRNNVDMLKVANNIEAYNIDRKEQEQIEWNFEIAREYNLIDKK